MHPAGDEVRAGATLIGSSSALCDAQPGRALAGLRLARPPLLPPQPVCGLPCVPPRARHCCHAAQALGKYGICANSAPDLRSSALSPCVSTHAAYVHCSPVSRAELCIRPHAKFRRNTQAMQELLPPGTPRRVRPQVRALRPPVQRARRPQVLPQQVSTPLVAITSAEWLHGRLSLTNNQKCAYAQSWSPAPSPGQALAHTSAPGTKVASRRSKSLVPHWERCCRRCVASSSSSEAYPHPGSGQGAVSFILVKACLSSRLFRTLACDMMSGCRCMSLSQTQPAALKLCMCKSADTRTPS